MKTFVVSAVSIVLVSILFCPMAIAAPSMPSDLQIVQPDPSLPKELSAFFGKWEATFGSTEGFIIVEKIDEEKASLYLWKRGFWPPDAILGWERIEARVIKERGKYKLWFPHRLGITELTLRGKYLDYSNPWGSVQHRQVP